MGAKRKIIADRMVKSKHNNAVITLTAEIDMTEASGLQNKIGALIQDQTNFSCTLTDFLLMATSRALMKHLVINASMEGDNILVHNYVNIGLAVGSGNGLIVPVLYNTHKMNFVEMVKNRGELMKTVKNKTLTPDDLKGSTFTIINLGMYGIWNLQRSSQTHSAY